MLQILSVYSSQNYVCKVVELAHQYFIDSKALGDEKGTPSVSVSGLVLAGSAHFKDKVAESSLLDGRLKRVIMMTVDVSYGGLSGFNQAIDLSAEVRFKFPHVHRWECPHV